MGAPKGQTSDKEFRNEVRKVVNELREAEGDDKTKKVRTLRLIARRLATEAINGDVAAINSIRDTLDGKPVQGVEMAVNVQVTEIKRIIVQPGQVIDTEFEEVGLVPALATSDA